MPGNSLSLLPSLHFVFPSLLLVNNKNNSTIIMKCQKKEKKKNGVRTFIFGTMATFPNIYFGLFAF